MLKEDLIKQLKSLKPKTKIKLACDEEWNVVFNDIEINIEGETGNAILFGLSRSEDNF